MEKKNLLIDFIKQVPQNRNFISTKSKSYTFGDVFELSVKLKMQYPEIVNKNCTLISNDRETLAILLPAIDSICHDILLLPKDLEIYGEEFYKNANIDYVIFLSEGSVLDIKKISKSLKIKKNEKGYILATSGTTGKSKLVKHKLTSLLSNTQNNIKRGEEFSWGLTYDLSRFAGLQVYLQSIAAGSSLIIPENSDSVSEVLELFYKLSVNCISATPSFWRKLLMEPNHVKINLKRITLGGEISGQTVLSALERSYPSAKIIHIYASTEAGVGFVVKDKKEGFSTSYLEKDSGLSCKLKVINERLWIKNATLSSQLVNGSQEVNDEGFINTGDMVIIKKNRVYFTGRESGSINVGGNKVMPEKVETVLEQHPYIVMAKVFSKASSLLGSIVACEVVLDKSVKELTFKDVKHDVLQACRSDLQPFEIPVTLRVVDSISTNSTGKKMRNI